MRTSRNAAVATLTAAALLLVGVDYATFASTGDSLLLGKLNQSRATTTLTKHGPGPALRLTSRGAQKPSLAVSSPARVRRLNADLLDGRSASTLETRATTFRAGSRSVAYPGQAIWRLPVSPGSYQVSFKAWVRPSNPAPSTSVGVICGVADLNTLGAATHVYTADSGTSPDGFPALLSGAETVRVTTSATPGVLCVTSDSRTFRLGGPITASWTPVNHRRVRIAEPVTPPTQAGDRILRELSR